MDFHTITEAVAVTMETQSKASPSDNTAKDSLCYLTSARRCEITVLLLSTVGEVPEFLCRYFRRMYVAGYLAGYGTIADGKGD